MNQLLLALLLAGNHHLGRYMWYSSVHVIGQTDFASVKLDRSGIPVVQYAKFYGTQYNPITITQWGLANASRGDMRDATRAANWLLADQRKDGVWPYHFAFAIDGKIEPVPWVSSIMQGQGISLLLRVWQGTNQRRYLLVAQRALLPFDKSINHGGVRSTVFGHTCYEEYAIPGWPMCVLNGFMSSVYGLYEMWWATGSRQALDLYRVGESTLAALLPRYSGGATKSYYDLGFQLHPGVQPIPAGGQYPLIHQRLLTVFARLTGRTIYGRYERAWVVSSGPPWRTIVSLGGLSVALLLMLCWRRLSVSAPARQSVHS